MFNIIGTTGGTGTAQSSRVPEIMSGFQRGSCC